MKKTPEKLIADLVELERRGQRAQVVLDRASTEWFKLHERILAEHPEAWKKHCEETGANEKYDFKDVLC